MTFNVNPCSSWASALLFLAVICPAAVSAQRAGCDPGLEAATGDFGYRLRETRCEGRYVWQDVASTSLTLASFVATFPKSMPNDAIGVAWTPSADAAEVYLRARDLRSGRFYRMDAEIRADRALFRWPTEVLIGLGMAVSDIGIIGWTHQSSGGESRKVYLPLRVAPSGESAEDYRLVILSGRRLSEVYLSLAPVAEDGRDGQPLLDGQLVGKDYMANTRIALSLPELAGPGLYHLEVGATLANEGVTSLDLYFQHPGPGPP